MAAVNFGLELAIDGPTLVLEIVNLTQTPLRIFTRACAWGCAAYTLQVQPQAGRAVRLRERERVWTRHGPVTAELAPGQHHRELFEATDSGWQAWQPLLAAHNTPWTLVMEMHVEPTEQAVESGVAASDGRSNAVLSQPPHPWLSTPGRPP